MFSLTSHTLVTAVPEGLDTTGKLPAAPKSLGLPGLGVGLLPLASLKREGSLFAWESCNKLHTC